MKIQMMLYYRSIKMTWSESFGMQKPLWHYPFALCHCCAHRKSTKGDLEWFLHHQGCCYIFYSRCTRWCITTCSSYRTNTQLPFSFSKAEAARNLCSFRQSMVWGSFTVPHAHVLNPHHPGPHLFFCASPLPHALWIDQRRFPMVLTPSVGMLCLLLSLRTVLMLYHYV